MDAEKELLKILSEEIANSIDNNIINTLLFDNKVQVIKALNREGQIDSILEDKPFISVIIEETDEYKMLTDDNKEKYKKYGKILCGEKKSKKP